MSASVKKKRLKTIQGLKKKWKYKNFLLRHILKNKINLGNKLIKVLRHVKHGGRYI